MTCPVNPNRRVPWSSGNPPELYKTIGGNLVLYDSNTIARGFVRSEAKKEFREGLSFVPIEMLESYLEDLLDLDIPDDKLFIGQVGVLQRSLLLPVLGLCGAVLVGVYAASAGASLFSSLSLSVVLALPFAALWHFAPQCRVNRRLAFAKLLSQEIFRRRGIDKDGRTGNSAVF